MSKITLFARIIKKGNVSKPIAELREIIWNEYLVDEVEFNVILMQDLYKVLDTPKHILDLLLTNKITELTGEKLKDEIIKYVENMQDVYFHMFIEYH